MIADLCDKEQNRGADEYLAQVMAVPQEWRQFGLGKVARDTDVRNSQILIKKETVQKQETEYL
jgi:hypothetical protein